MTTATRNGFPTEARPAAEVYPRKGLAPIPPPPRSKDPGYPDWQHRRLSPETLDQHFPRGAERNVGNLNGEPSGNAADVDLDSPEARRAADRLLPPTGWVFGRKSSPRSHWEYRTDEPFGAASAAYADLDGQMLVELRGTGGLTVFPPSTHQETGEDIRWERFEEPAHVALTDLARAVWEVAAAALLARHWPDEGNRDRAAMALSGGLARAGWSDERVSCFALAVAEAAGDEGARSRANKAERTCCARFGVGSPALLMTTANGVAVRPDGSLLRRRVARAAAAGRSWRGHTSGA